MRHQQSCLGGGGGRASASSPAPPPCYPLLVEYLTGVASSTQQLLINSAVWATHTTTAASAQHIYGRKQKKKGWFNDNDNFACGRGPTCHRLLLSLCTFCVLSRMATWERNFISLRRWHKWRHWRAADSACSGLLYHFDPTTTTSCEIPRLLSRKKKNMPTERARMRTKTKLEQVALNWGLLWAPAGDIRIYARVKCTEGGTAATDIHLMWSVYKFGRCVCVRIVLARRRRWLY